jgi:hypothetical protein
VTSHRLWFSRRRHLKLGGDLHFQFLIGITI